MKSLVLVLSTVALMTPAAEECSVIEAAHEALLKSSFECERHFTLELNEDLKMRLIARMTYRNGEITRETLEKEIFDKRVKYEAGEAEAALDVPFDCTHLQQAEEGTVELSNPEGTERVTFSWNAQEGVLRPIRWVNIETQRLLWKKFVFEATADYRACEWE